MTNAVDRNVQAATLCEAFQHTAERDPEGVALRTVGGGVEITWRQYRERVRRIAAGLAGLGVGRGDTVALMMTNRPEFHLVDTAAIHLGAVPYSIYNTNPAEQIAHLLGNAGSRVVICERQFAERVRAAGSGVEHLVVLDDPGAALTLKTVEAGAREDFDFDRAWRAVRPDDLLTLIYTSGTTGTPKGVEITHANVIAQVEAVSTVYGMEQGDRTVSYLPAAHIADRLVGHYAPMVHGVATTTVADPAQIAAALADARPHFWFAVPRVWHKMKVALEQGFSQATGEQAGYLRRALELGRKRAAELQGGAALDPAERAELDRLDQAVLGPVRARIGLADQRWAMAGAAAVEPETLEFFLGLGLRVCEIWGMSETAGAGIVTPPDRIRPGKVGRPLPGVEIRVAGDGEMLLRGPMVMRGYRGDPARTAEALDGDGWLRTGDVVAVDDEGFVKIVDRKKELMINAAGKNMSPVHIEQTIKAACPLVGEIVAIADSRPYTTALVVLDPDAVAALTGNRELAPAEAAGNPDIVARVLAGVVAANERLSRVEQIKRLRIVPTYWVPGGTELTPTMKLRRRPIATTYAEEIESMYEDVPGPEVHDLRDVSSPAAAARSARG
ncbi:MAG TPA: AMP-binding protein [Amycolatopsis sp.]|nr:AMP-binding protein [Amycolatopsis sp.]